jgi:uncharacterized membrane protein YccF (DUF307 family)
MASPIVRVLWFLLIGWWAALIWLAFAVVLMLTVIGFPVGIVMLYKTWKVATLESNPTAVVEHTFEDATN